MKEYVTKEIEDRYKETKLIVPSYASRKVNYYSVDDLKDFESLKYCLSELSDHEAYITSDGMNFLKESIGLKELSKALHRNKWYLDEHSSAEEIYEWLLWWDSESVKYDS